MRETETSELTSGLLVLWSIDRVNGSWVYGSFQLKVGKSLVGDDEDYAALNVAFNWIETYLSGPVEIDSASLDGISKEEVVKNLYDSYMVYKIFPEDQRFESFEGVPSNCISYLGASAFDGWLLLCINRDSYQRLIWADLSSRIVEEAFLEPETLQAALRCALEEYKRALVR